MFKGLQMIPTAEYLVEDVEKFIKINKINDSKVETKIMQNLLDVQDKISIFKGIEPEELKAILYNLKFVTYRFKDYVVEQGEVSREIFYIISGKCHVFHGDHTIAHLGHGEVFGESGAIFKTKRNASVVCSTEKMTLLSFNIDDNNMEFCGPALATLYKNLASEINAKLQEINVAFTRR